MEILIGILGLVITTSGVVLAIHFYLRTRTIRRLTCAFPPPVNLDLRPEAIRGTAREKLTAHFGTVDLHSVSVIQATLLNTGTEPIRLEQLEEPIAFSFPTGIAVLDVEVIEKSPKVEVIPVPPGTGDGPVLQWRFRSLDLGEYFSLQFLLDSPSRELPRVSTRILGIPSGITIEPPKQITEPRLISLGFKPRIVGAAITVAMLLGILAGFNAARVVLPPVVVETPPRLLQGLAREVAAGEYRLRLGVRVSLGEKLWIYSYEVNNLSRDLALRVIWKGPTVGPLLEGTVAPGKSISNDIAVPDPPGVALSTVQFGPTLQYATRVEILFPTSASAPSGPVAAHLNRVPVVDRNSWVSFVSDPTIVGGKIFDEGLQVSNCGGPCSVTFDLQGKYDQFSAVIGVPDRASPGGRAIFRIFVDGRQVFASQALSAGQHAVPIRIPVRGGRALKLEVEHAGFAAEQLAFWGLPRVIRR